MGKPTHYWPYIILIGAVVCLATAAGWWMAMRTIDTDPIGSIASSQDDQDTDNRIVHLYFSDSQGRYLKAEQRTIHAKQDMVLFGRLIIEELIRGPQYGGVRTLPAQAQIRTFFMVNPGTAYVDFDTNAFDNHPGGIGAELLSIYSVVNSLILNSDVIRSVQFLIGGQEPVTMVGHMDISQPLSANMLLIR